MFSMKREDPKQKPPVTKVDRHAKSMVEDERGWAGQHGQRPANEEGKNYRPNSRENSPEKESGR